MDQTAHTQINHRIEATGRIEETDALSLVAVAQGRDEGEVTAAEALETLRRGHVAAVLGILSRFSDRASLDEADCLDTGLAAVERAATKYDPARGTFSRWAGRFIWQALAKKPARAQRDRPPTVSLDGPDGDPIDIADPHSMVPPAADPPPPVPHDATRLLDLPEAARRLGVSHVTLYRWVAQKKIPNVRIGRLVRFRVDDLARWIDARSR